MLGAASLLAGIQVTAASASAPMRAEGGTATVAWPPGEVPNFIIPFMDWDHQGLLNIAQFQKLMYRPLYWASKGDQPVVNPDLSLAEPPNWNADHTVATIKLKDYQWSDGTKLTPRNVAFWMGFARYAADGWVGNSKKYWPAILDTVAYDDAAGTVTFNLKQAVSPDWFQNNVLASTTPLPLAWDLEGATTPGTCSSENPAEQEASCKKVREYLYAQGEDLGTYSTNPLWQVVSGPWKLKEFNADGNITMVPNPTYSGPVKPKLAELKFVPFTSEAAELNTLKADNSITVGYLPTTDAPPAGDGFVPSQNPIGDDYTILPRYTWGFNYLVLNMNNPSVGAMFKQLYFRQAIQHSVDQRSMITAALRGYGVVTSGPLPRYPENPYVGDAGKTETYPFDEAKARQLMLDNGWEIKGDGPATCVKPGAAAGQCGEGVAAGATAAFKLEFMSGSAAVSAEMQALQSSARKAGIQVELAEAPYNTVIANATTCTSDDPLCSWNASHWGAGWTFLTSFYPSGEKLFGSGSGSNYSNYSDPKMDELIAKVTSSADADALKNYEAYAAQQLPVIYLPTVVSLVVVDKRLQGFTPNPLQVLTPEEWSLS